MRLTIAIPTVDRDFCIRRAVTSALAQSAPELEVIVSNNASTDGTRAVLDELSRAARDPRLRIIHHEYRLSMSDHGDFLREQARGDLFLCLSDDDWLEPTFANRVLTLFDEHPEIDFAYTGCDMHVSNVIVPSKVGPEVETSVDFLDAYFAGRRNVYWCGCVVRVNDLRRIGRQPEDRLIGDMYYWTKLALEGSVGCVGDHLSHYTFLADNISIGIRADIWAGETALLGQEVLSGLSRRQVASDRLATVAANVREYVGRSTANQIVLNAQRGMPKAQLIATILACSRYIVWDLTGLPRIGAAVMLPPTLLRRLTLRLASRLQRQASNDRSQRV